MGSKEEQELRWKLSKDVDEEIRQLRSVLDSLDDDDADEICQSLSNMFYIGFNYAKSKFVKK